MASNSADRAPTINLLPKPGQPPVLKRQPCCYNLADMDKCLTAEKDELIRRCFVGGYVKALGDVIYELATADCPADCNTIDAMTLEFVQRDDAVSNFNGITALMKYEQKALKKLNPNEVEFEWKGKVLCNFPYAGVTDADISEYIKKYDPFQSMKSDSNWIAEANALFFEAEFVFV